MLRIAQPLALHAAAPFDPGPAAFDLDHPAAYRLWRSRKLALRPASAAALVVDLQDPQCLTERELAQLRHAIDRAGIALYRLAEPPDAEAAPATVLALAAQLGLRRLDANWLADTDGLSRITVAVPAGGAAGGATPTPAHRDTRTDYIPYTDHAIRWHTDGYYHPRGRRIEGMLLHCVRPAAAGGINRVFDPELAYIALRDASPALVRALMRPDAMTIPARQGEAGEARAAQSGPVIDTADGWLHLRYTARTRSIAWHPDPLVQTAAHQLACLLKDDPPWALRIRLEAGMGLIGHNVLHDRSAFSDSAVSPRLLLRGRFLDRVAPHHGLAAAA